MTPATTQSMAKMIIRPELDYNVDVTDDSLDENDNGYVDEMI